MNRIEVDKILDNFEKEQSELKAKRDKESERERRINDFLRPKFTERHRWKLYFSLICLTIAGVLAIFTVKRNAYIILGTLIIFEINVLLLIHSYYYKKLKQEFGILEDGKQ